MCIYLVYLKNITITKEYLISSYYFSNLSTDKKLLMLLKLLKAFKSATPFCFQWL